jgi:hypothetical protein
MPIFLPYSLYNSFPMLYFVLYLNLSLQVLKIMLRGSHVKVPETIDHKFIILTSSRRSHLFCEDPRRDALFAVFEILLFVILVQLQCGIAAVRQFFVCCEGVVRDGEATRLALVL